MGEKIASATTPPGPAPLHLHLGPALAPCARACSRRSDL